MSAQIESLKTASLQNNAEGFKLLGQTVDNENTEKLIEIAGYSYDASQDIFCSVLDPWQRNVGYCRLYDEAAAPLGMIIDCEPIYFEYNEKKWMISLWKGQYDLVTGGEIGVYIEAFNLKLPGLSNGICYRCAGDDDLLQMSYTLKKNGKTLFKREGIHWWLTGFKLGEFSEPAELVMDVNITLKDAAMRDAFISGLRATGYAVSEFFVHYNTVSFRFGTPKSPQPLTRKPTTDRLIQKKNKLLCEKYQEITESFDTIQDKLQALQDKSPELYRKIMTIGKAKPLEEIFESMLNVFLVMLAIYLSYKILIVPHPSE